MPHDEFFVCMLVLSRPQPIPRGASAAQRVFRSHDDRLRQGRDEDRVLLSGPRTDGTFGIVIFRAVEKMQASCLGGEDPRVGQA